MFHQSHKDEKAIRDNTKGIGFCWFGKYIPTHSDNMYEKIEDYEFVYKINISDEYPQMIRIFLDIKAQPWKETDTKEY